MYRKNYLSTNLCSVKMNGADGDKNVRRFNLGNIQMSFEEKLTKTTNTQA
jgi:hypothetical protein